MNPIAEKQLNVLKSIREGALWATIAPQTVQGTFDGMTLSHLWMNGYWRWDEASQCRVLTERGQALVAQST